MLDRVYHVTAQGVMDLVLVQVTLVLVEDGHALEVGSKELYIQPEMDPAGAGQDLRLIARALDALADEA